MSREGKCGGVDGRVLSKCSRVTTVVNVQGKRKFSGTIIGGEGYTVISARVT